MLRSVFPRAHQKYFSLPLLGPITDGFDDWLAASGFTLGSRTPWGEDRTILDWLESL